MVSSLVLIPFLGTQRTFLVFALVIGAAAVAGIGIRFAPVAAADRRRARDPGRHGQVVRAPAR